MLEPNNPEIDLHALERRVRIELERPERSVAPPPAAPAMTAGPADPILSLKYRLRRIPLVGPALAGANRWQRRHRLVSRALGTPVVGYTLRWLKSLALVHQTRRSTTDAHRLIAEQAHATAQNIQAVAQAMAAVDQRLAAEAALAGKRYAAVQAELAELRDALRHLGSGVAEGQDTQRADTAELHRRLDGLQREIVFQQRRLTTVLETVTDMPGRLPQPAPRLMAGALDSYYAAFEEAFRGSREEIKERFAVYLERAAEAAAAAGGRPFLDVGCGRGEWLELLAERGIGAYGIDLNSVAVERCRGLGLDAREAEALTHLRALPDASLGGVTGFHVIEHLDFEMLIALLDEANRALAPGGLLLFETPNPENVQVGSCTFWNDPTHRNPLPPLVAKFMVERRGFRSVEIVRLHPIPEDQRLAEPGETAARFNHFFYGPQDYAVAARRI